MGLGRREGRRTATGLYRPSARDKTEGGAWPSHSLNAVLQRARRAEQARQIGSCQLKLRASPAINRNARGERLRNHSAPTCR